MLREGTETYALAADGQELTFFFEYRPATLADRPAGMAAADKKPKPPTQKELLQAAQERIEALAATDVALVPWLAALAQPYVRADGTASGKTRLQVHLERYTARNTFDYFIHKDLGGFLRRELDFYLKNEVLHLDNIEQDSAPRVEQFLSKLRVLRKVAGHLIDFLAQLEDFQRKLWLKKKLVVDTQWCLTLDKVPAALLPTVAANEAQRQEWVALFGIEALAADAATPGYSVPLSVAFLQAYPNLVLDTRHFPADFTERLLASLDGNLDELTDGLLIHGENFQALNLLQERYREQVDCVYIDPPYNTGSDNSFAYKDSYQHSSWYSLISDRSGLARSLTKEEAGIFVSTDDGEYAGIRFLLGEVWGDENFVADIIWNSRKSVSNDALISVAANHTTFFAKNKTKLDANKKTFRLAQPEEGFSNPNDDPDGAWKLDPIDAPNIRENLQYPITNEATGEVFYPPRGRHWGREQAETERLLQEGRILFGRNGTSRPMYKRYLWEAKAKGKTPTTLWDDVKTTSDATKLLLNIFDNDILRDLIDKIKPKPTQLVERCATLLTNNQGTVLDFFAGSGTTGHAVINLNREDEGKRKFILVEMGDYFHAVTLPRLKKVTYTPEWKDGRPRRQPTAEETARGPKLLKVIRLESYEDTLNNLVLKRPEPVQTTLFPATDTAAIAAARQDYVLRYLLDVESRGSRSLLDVPAFRDPTAYTLDVKAPGSDHTETQAVDLLETFHYLLGLRVRQVGASQTLVADFEHADHVVPGDGAGRLRLKGALRRAATGPWWVRPVTGTLADGRRVLIIWRKLTADTAQDNLVLNAWFAKHDYSVRDTEFDLIYVNGDNNLENLRQPDDTWKVQLIEDAFHRLLFAEQAH